jgi:hypothetical protein
MHVYVGPSAHRPPDDLGLRQKQTASLRWARRKEALGDAGRVVGGCLVGLAAVAVVLAAAGGFLYGVVRTARLAWSGT